MHLHEAGVAGGEGGELLAPVLHFLERREGDAPNVRLAAHGDSCGGELKQAGVGVKVLPSAERTLDPGQ